LQRIYAYIQGLFAIGCTTTDEAYNAEEIRVVPSKTIAETKRERGTDHVFVLLLWPFIVLLIICIVKRKEGQAMFSFLI
jgi:hypothetical protein